MSRAVTIGFFLAFMLACNKSATSSTPTTSVSLDGLDQSCAADADCQIVSLYPCAQSGCDCSDKAIAKKALPEFEKRSKSVKCGPPDTRECGECRPYRAVCETGKCVGKY